MKPGMLRYYLLTVIIIALNSIGLSQDYSPVDKSSAIKFSIKNFGLPVGGSFTGLQGTIHFNPAALPLCMFNLSVDANTVNTGMGARDNHLRKEDYFNVQKYPILNFVSKQIKAGDKPGSYLLTGTFTIKGISKQISLPFTVVPLNDGLLFSGECKLNRKDFKVGASSLILSDNLMVSLSIFAKKS